MFLNKKNSLDLIKIIIAAFIVLILCITGILFWDIPVFNFMRQFDNHIWILFDMIFAAKIWIGTTGVLVIYFYIKNHLISKTKSKKIKQKINIIQKIRDFIVKAKTYHVFLIFLSVLLSSITTGILKFIIGRSRPIIYEAQQITDFIFMSFNWGFNSIPSGHTTASFAGLVMIGLLYPRFKWATWSGAIIIGLSRVFIGDHWPTDIILGAFIGMISADIIYMFYHRKK